MNKSLDKLIRSLSEIRDVLLKFKHLGQARVVEDILAAVGKTNPDFAQLRSIDMWGGAGAVWEVSFSTPQMSEEMKADEQSFRRAIIDLVEAMNQMGISTDRSQFICATFQDWLTNGL
jgi:hypothetical protein